MVFRIVRPYSIGMDPQHLLKDDNRRLHLDNRFLQSKGVESYPEQSIQKGIHLADRALVYKSRSLAPNRKFEENTQK